MRIAFLNINMLPWWCSMFVWMTLCSFYLLVVLTFQWKSCLWMIIWLIWIQYVV